LYSIAATLDSLLDEMLADIGKVKLRKVPQDERQDRSAANTSLSGVDELADEAERWKYFFEAGCSGWFEAIKDYTFRSTFVELHPEEAKTIVDHWEQRCRLQARAEALGKKESEACQEEISLLFKNTSISLDNLQGRLDTAIATECSASSAGLAFVKLSTRSPKDSKKALQKAAAAYRERLSVASEEVAADDNERWQILSEEVTRAGAVNSGAAAIELLLDSERVYEDLEYALRGPKTHRTTTGESTSTDSLYGMSIVARAWDPRLTPQSEFRGICWGGKLTCLGQYFHPLFFPDLLEKRDAIAADCQKLFEKPAIVDAVGGLGGCCIVDFAWLGPGEVIIVELNPFDGLCLGTFPASTGLFLWDNEPDRAIMKGESNFEMRVREERSTPAVLKNQCNRDWRRIIYNESF